MSNDVLTLEREIKHLREQVHALAEANVRAAELMAELREARELEALLLDRNHELQRAHALGHDRNCVLELVAKNETLARLFEAIARLVAHQDAGASFSVTIPPGRGPLEMFCYGPLRSFAEQLEPAIEEIDFSAAGLARASIREVWVRNPMTDSTFAPYQALAAQHGVRSCFSSLVRSGAGKTMGIVTFYTNSEGDPTAADRHLLETVVILTSLALEHRQLYEELAYRARYDALTELPNRVWFEERLDQALAAAKRLQLRAAVLWIDLDRFKSVNDLLGHPVGDGLLQEIARRLSQCIRETDVAARMGGDEFAIILEHLNDAEGAEQVAEKISCALQLPAQVLGHSLEVSASIGIALYPDHGDDASSLVRNADMAMYGAKCEGKNTYRMYNSETTEPLRGWLAIEGQLRQALSNDELRLVYQPQCRLDGSIFAFEALLRWDSPELGSVAPSDLIPVAEATGMIVPIGKWVMREACAQAAEWARAGNPVRVAVNISALECMQADFAEMVLNAMERCGLEPELLELELTEGCLMRSPVRCASQLRMLRQKGIRIAIDDFGTGYSSLSRLQELPVDSLKIDRSFIQQIDSGSKTVLPMIQAMVRLARTLNLVVVAEGVETRQQMQALESAGCDIAQGFLFHRPLPAEEVGQLLTNRSLQSLANAVPSASSEILAEPRP